MQPGHSVSDSLLCASDRSPGLAHGSEHGGEAAPERSQSESNDAGSGARSPDKPDVLSLFLTSPSPPFLCVCVCVSGPGADEGVDQQVERDAEHSQGLFIVYVLFFVLIFCLLIPLNKKEKTLKMAKRGEVKKKV